MSIRVLSTSAQAILLAATLAAATGCAATAPQGRVYVRLKPPAPIVETRVAAPGPGYVWIPGFHAWNGRQYVWRPGRWERAPRHNARWVPAHWVHDDRRGWYLVEGHWR